MSRIRTFALVTALSWGAAVPAWGESLQLTVTTTQGTGNYAPRNIVAVWVEDQGGTFVKTIGRWANTRKQHLVAWQAKAGANDADAVSGATRQNHATPLTITWDLKNKANAIVPDGTYTIRMESTDLNANQAAQNHQGTFTFVKGAAAQTQNNLSNGGFTNVTITYDPQAASATCNNGVVEANERCDPSVAGSCPATCAQSADACQPNVLVGASASCTAECAVQPITTCIDGDGCCADGCDESTDEDCAAGASGSGTEITGGCTTGGGAALPFALGLAALALSRSTRRRGA